MADNLSKEDRRKNMQAIRSTNTKIEVKVTKELWRRGLRFRKNVKNLFGKPDIAIKKYKAVVFIDSCFFHGCPLHGNVPVSNRDYWVSKLYQNAKRDLQVNNYYYEKGWHLLRIWEHQVKGDFERTILGILQFFEDAKENINDFSNPI